MLYFLIIGWIYEAFLEIKEAYVFPAVEIPQIVGHKLA